MNPKYAGGENVGVGIGLFPQNRNCLAGAAPKEAESAVSKISSAFAASTTLSERVTHVVDRIAGPLGHGASQSVVNPGNGVIPDLVDQAEVAKASIGDAHAALSRLEALFGI